MRSELSKIKTDKSVIIFNNNKYIEYNNIHNFTSYINKIRENISDINNIWCKHEITDQIKDEVIEHVKTFGKDGEKKFYDSRPRTPKQKKTDMFRGVLSEHIYYNIFPNSTYDSKQFTDGPDNGWDFINREKIDVKFLNKNDAFKSFRKKLKDDIYYAFVTISKNNAYYIGTLKGDFINKNLYTSQYDGYYFIIDKLFPNIKLYFKNLVK